MPVAGSRPLLHPSQRAGASREPERPPIVKADLARFREATYQLVSQTFLYPKEERLEAVAAVADELWKASDALAPLAFYVRWRELLGVLRQVDQQDARAIQGRYVSLFAANSTGVPCQPYESAYREASGEGTGWVLAQLEGTYAAAGVSVAGTTGEMPDHVSVEMEYLAFLCGQEAEAWEQERVNEASAALGKQKRFLGRHLSVWFPLFARRVAAADSDGVFRTISEGAQAFMGHDVDLIDALLQATPVEAEAG
jgi:TorA maturation chaperone TorD